MKPDFTIEDLTTDQTFKLNGIPEWPQLEFYINFEFVTLAAYVTVKVNCNGVMLNVNSLEVDFTNVRRENVEEHIRLSVEKLFLRAVESSKHYLIRYESKIRITETQIEALVNQVRFEKRLTKDTWKRLNR